MKNGSWDDVEQVDPPVLLRGDCLKLLKRVRDHSVRAAIFDPPYGTTFLLWDEVIDFDSLWAELNRILLPDGVAAIFAAHPFTNKVISSNERNFKYQWIWKKTRGTGFLHVRRSQSLRIYEDILVFYKRLGVYHPQMIPLDEPRWSRPAGNSKMYKAIRINKGLPKAKLIRSQMHFDRLTLAESCLSTFGPSTREADTGPSARASTRCLPRPTQRQWSIPVSRPPFCIIFSLADGVSVAGRRFL